MCGTQVSISGLLAKDPATVPDGLPWTPCNFIQYNTNRFIFGDHKIFWYLVVPLTNSASMNNCPLVQGKSNKHPSPPPPLPRCVCGGGGEGDSYSMILHLFLLS